MTHMIPEPPEVYPCHEDPRLGEQDETTPLDHIMAPQLESLRAMHLQSQEGDTPLPLAATLGKSAFYPSANRTRLYFGDTLGGVAFSYVRAIVMHSTETSGLPGYQGGKSAPNLTADFNEERQRIDWYHHYRLNQSSRALVHPAGVQTNNSNVIQIECVGTTAKGGPGTYLPNAPDWWLDDMAEFFAFMHVQWGIPLRSTVSWESYPSSYGLRNGVRLGASAWLGYSGILAHQHVFGNDHGDVWLNMIQEIIKRAGGTTPPKPRPPVTDFPAFPLPNGYWFGPATGGSHSISGFFSYRNALTPWQSQMKKRGWTIATDGVYGPQTADVARTFQREKGLVVDGLVGKQTWDAAWTAKITS